jgi:hypothetical protein
MFAHTGEFSLHGAAHEPRWRWPHAALKAVGAALVIGLSAVVRPVGDATTERDAAPVVARPDPGVIAHLDRRPTHNGRYSAEVVAASPISEGALQSWTIHVAGRTQRRIAHADVGVEVWMPVSGERASVHPTVRYVGNGNYRVDSLCFPHAGWWNVALVIDGRAGVDSAAFNVVLPSRQRSSAGLPPAPGLPYCGARRLPLAPATGATLPPSVNTPPLGAMRRLPSPAFTTPSVPSHAA